MVSGTSGSGLKSRVRDRDVISGQVGVGNFVLPWGIGARERLEHFVAHSVGEKQRSVKLLLELAIFLLEFQLRMETFCGTKIDLPAFLDPQKLHLKASILSIIIQINS